MADHEEVARPELARLVRGRGQFLDDVKLPGMCYAVFVRSEYAHANIVSIDVEEAMKVPGAIGVITPDEVLPNVNPIRPAAPGSSEYARPYDRFPMPPGKVTFVGRPNRSSGGYYSSRGTGYGGSGCCGIRPIAGHWRC